VLRAACIHPVEHYGLPVGLLRVGDPADFIVVDDVTTMHVRQTWIDGRLVAEHGHALWNTTTALEINAFHAAMINVEDIRDTHPSSRVRAIVAHDGELVTTAEEVNINDEDVCKLVVLNRYQQAPPAIGYIKGLGIRSGGFASTVAHDCHNIIAAGKNDADIVAAVNALVLCKGGISISDMGSMNVLPLPVGGLMSTASADEVANRYIALDQRVKAMGSTLRAPFMTLSFMALLVIPSLKLSDKGLFDGRTFTFCDVHV
jgi:adenine deaminase